MKELLEKFHVTIPHIEKIGKKYYQISPELKKRLDEIGRKPEYVGKYLGEEKKQFYASAALLELIAEKSDKKAFVNDKAEWMFLCGKDVFSENCEGLKHGTVLVQNSEDENLGLGRFEKKRGKFMLVNLFDRVHFLRRE